MGLALESFLHASVSIQGSTLLYPTLHIPAEKPRPSTLFVQFIIVLRHSEALLTAAAAGLASDKYARVSLIGQVFDAAADRRRLLLMTGSARLDLLSYPRRAQPRSGSARRCVNTISEDPGTAAMLTGH